MFIVESCGTTNMIRDWAGTFFFRLCGREYSGDGKREGEIEIEIEQWEEKEKKKSKEEKFRSWCAGERGERMGI
jgi:hypothetical protein